MHRPRRTSMAESISEVRRQSIALANNPTLQTFRLVMVPEEEQDASDNEFESLLPEPDATTKTVFGPHTRYLLMIVLHESFDHKEDCLDALSSIVDDANHHLRVDMYITHHPDDDMSELKISGSKYSRVTCDNCSAAETDTGRMVTVGMSLKTLFDQHQITRKYVVIVCCGEDIEYDMVKDLDDYVNDRHECIVVYGHQELQKLSTDVTKMVKWMRKASKSRDKRSRRR